MLLQETRTRGLWIQVLFFAFARPVSLNSRNPILYCTGQYQFFNLSLSRIGLGFLNLTSQLRQANAIGFCMQTVRIVNDISERERPWCKGKVREMGKTSFFRCTIKIQKITKKKM